MAKVKSEKKQGARIERGSFAAFVARQKKAGKTTIPISEIEKFRAGRAKRVKKRGGGL